MYTKVLLICKVRGCTEGTYHISKYPAIAESTLKIIRSNWPNGAKPYPKTSLHDSRGNQNKTVSNQAEKNIVRSKARSLSKATKVFVSKQRPQTTREKSPLTSVKTNRAKTASVPYVAVFFHSELENKALFPWIANRLSGGPTFLQQLQFCPLPISLIAEGNTFL